jgi:hypothetical protein
MITKPSIVIGSPLFTIGEFPADFDTTALGLTVMNTDEHTVLSIIDEMLEHLNADGIIQVSGTVCSH